MSFIMSQAVQKICTKVGDPNREHYCVKNSGYDGRAKDSFWEGVIDILTDMYKDKKLFEEEKGKSASISSMFSDDDVKGLITTENTIIGKETSDYTVGKIKYSELTNFFKLKDIYPDPDGINQLPFIIKKTDINYFKGIKGENFVRDDTVYWYSVGDGIIFYPKADTTTKEHTEELDFNDNTPSADTIAGVTDYEADDYVVGGYIYITDSANNDGTYTIKSLSTTTITLIDTDELTGEQDKTCTIGITYAIQVMFIAEPQIASYDYGANPSGDGLDLTDLFSLTFIYKAIELASQKIENEKEKT